MYPEVTEDLREDVEEHAHGLRHSIVQLAQPHGQMQSHPLSYTKRDNEGFQIAGFAPFFVTRCARQHTAF